MKITKSIHWRLLLWIGFLLGLALLALDFTAYEIHFNKLVGQLDGQLQRRLAFMSAAFSESPGGPRPELGPPEPGEDRFGPPPAAPGDLPESSPGRGGPNAARISNTARRFAGEVAAGFYFSIWTRDDTVSYRQSTNCPAGLARPQVTNKDTGTYARTRDGFREIFHATEFGDCVLVGHTLAAERSEARQFVGWLGLGSLVVLAFGLGGAWFIIAGALRPVKSISAAAVKISSGDLSQRIDLAETDSELGQLAAVLNTTFARLEAAFTRQKQFTADAAHELRTPVSVILTHAQNGLASSCPNDEHREAFAACQRAAQRMKKLLGALLALARLDDRPDNPRRTRFDLAQTVRESAASMQALAAERQVKIFTELPALEISGDAEQLAQVVFNLLTNAVQYNHPDGEVRVKLEWQNQQAVLTVADHGAGIAPADLPRVFERFYRGDRSRSSPGLGLGLAISKAIVEAHGGRITVAGNEGGGSLFTVFLPEIGQR